MKHTKIGYVFEPVLIIITIKIMPKENIRNIIFKKLSFKRFTLIFLNCFGVKITQNQLSSFLRWGEFDFADWSIWRPSAFRRTCAYFSRTGDETWGHRSRKSKASHPCVFEYELSSDIWLQTVCHNLYTETAFHPCEFFRALWEPIIKQNSDMYQSFREKGVGYFKRTINTNT